MNTTQFHDWTLVDVVFEWARARVAVALIGPSSTRRVLLAEDVSSLDMPRKNPWGKSVSVNSVLIADVPGLDEQSLEIEMQSGDVIRVNAKKIAVQD